MSKITKLSKNTPEAKQRNLTIKQRKWLQLYIKLGNAKEAARQVYDCTDGSAGVIGWENLQKLNYSEAMEMAGLTDKLLLQSHLDGIGAYRSDMTGQILPDFKVRHQYLETALKLKKRFNDTNNFSEEFTMTWKR